MTWWVRCSHKDLKLDLKQPHKSCMSSCIPVPLELGAVAQGQEGLRARLTGKMVNARFSERSCLNEIGE